MIKIRLQRHGARHSQFYRMVVTPSTTRRDGKFIEVLGTYNPKAHARAEELKLKMDRIDHWLGVGAQPTDTAKSLIRQGRLTPEEWLKKSEREAAKRLARAQKSDVAPEMEAKKEEAPVAEPEAKAEEPKAEEKAVAEVKEDKKEEAPAAKPEAKAEESKPEKKAVAEVKEDKKEEAPAAKPEAKAEESKSKKKATAEAKEEKKEAKPKAKAEDAKPVKKAPASKSKEEESK